MSREEAIAEIRDQFDNPDQEIAHVEVDNVLCNLLETLGYGDVVEEYNKINKWYA